MEEVPLSPIQSFLNIITNPALAAILLTIGLNAILFELSSPGGYAAGVVGAICLLLAFYALGTLNANWAGLGFVAVAFVLFVLDIKAPTHGVLTVGGIASFVFGLFLLFNTPELEVPWPTIIGLALVTAAFFAFAIAKALAAQHRRPTTGMESVVGQTAQVRTALEPAGMVFFNGELWKAETESGPLAVGETCRHHRPGRVPAARAESVIALRVECADELTCNVQRGGFMSRLSRKKHQSSRNASAQSGAQAHLDAVMRRVEALLLADQVNQAIQVLESNQARLSQFAPFRAALATLYGQVGRNYEAAVEARIAVDLDPRHADYYLLAAVSYFAAGYYSFAQRARQQWLRSAPYGPLLDGMRRLDEEYRAGSEQLRDEYNLRDTKAAEEAGYRLDEGRWALAQNRWAEALRHSQCCRWVDPGLAAAPQQRLGRALLPGPLCRGDLNQ